MNNKFMQKLLLTELLSLEEKMTVIFIASNKGENNEITISYSELSTMLGKSKSTVRKYIKSLEAKSFITSKNNIGADGAQLPNTYEINIDESWGLK